MLLSILCEIKLKSDSMIVNEKTSSEYKHSWADVFHQCQQRYAGINSACTDF